MKMMEAGESNPRNVPPAPRPGSAFESRMAFKSHKGLAEIRMVIQNACDTEVRESRPVPTSGQRSAHHHGALIDGAHAGIVGRRDAIEAELREAAVEGVGHY